MTKSKSIILSNKVKGFADRRETLHLFLKLIRRMKRLYPDCAQDKIILGVLDKIEYELVERVRENDR